MNRTKLKIELFFSMLMSILISFSNSGIDNNSIIIYAGAGMKTPLGQIGREFTGRTGVKVLYDFQGSGKLLNKIVSGAVPDLYITASQMWADKCSKKSSVVQKFDLAYHIPVLVYNPRKVKIVAFEDLKNKKISLTLGQKGIAAIGNESFNILKKASMEISDLNVVAYAQTVKQIIFYVKQGYADSGIVWRADALEEKDLHYVPIPEKYYSKERIVLCVMERSIKRKSIINQYLSFMVNDGLRIFKENGFYTIDTGSMDFTIGKEDDD